MFGVKVYSVKFYYFQQFLLCLVHPCDRDHGCQHRCIKDDSAEKFHCQCKSSEYKLGANGKDCIIGNLCPRLKINSLLFIHYDPLISFGSLHFAAKI